MVRRGSTVRVRQRALQKPRSRGFFIQSDLLDVERAVGVEHVVEQSDKKRPKFVVSAGNYMSARPGRRVAASEGKLRDDAEDPAAVAGVEAQ
jgi:hypothetical protein